MQRESLTRRFFESFPGHRWSLQNILESYEQYLMEHRSSNNENNVAFPAIFENIFDLLPTHQFTWRDGHLKHSAKSGWPLFLPTIQPKVRSSLSPSLSRSLAPLWVKSH